jgi:CRISPR/Cas system type I-B associated protein Csh2 (Cas7 group RAMP superfamily)
MRKHWKKRLEDSSAAKAVGAKKRIADEIKTLEKKKVKIVKAMNAEKDMIEREISELRKKDY